jgi:ketosteroid isomerase-like protein
MDQTATFFAAVERGDLETVRALVAADAVLGDGRTLFESGNSRGSP